MVDSEFVAVGAETQARLTDLGVMPKPGGEGEQLKSDAGAQARANRHEARPSRIVLSVLARPPGQGASGSRGDLMALEFAEFIH